MRYDPSARVVLMTSSETRAPPSRPTSSRMNGARGWRGRVRPIAGRPAGLVAGFVAGLAGLVRPGVVGLAGLVGLVGLVAGGR